MQAGAQECRHALGRVHLALANEALPFKLFERVAAWADDERRVLGREAVPGRAERLVCGLEGKEDDLLVADLTLARPTGTAHCQATLKLVLLWHLERIRDAILGGALALDGTVVSRIGPDGRLLSHLGPETRARLRGALQIGTG